MSLKERILADRMSAMKEGNQVKKNTLSSLISECDRVTKTPDDVLVINQIKKMIEANIECQVQHENVYLECYLPTALTNEELTNIITNEVGKHGYNNIKNMSQIMTHLSSNHAGQYDGKIASTIIKKLLVQ